MLTLQEAIRTWASMLRRTTVAEPTSREAMDMPVDASEGLGSFSLLFFCWVIVICIIYTKFWLYRAAVAPNYHFGFHA